MKYLFILLLTLVHLHGHTFSLWPSNFITKKNELVSVKILIGHIQTPEEYGRNPFHIKRFNLHQGTNQSMIFGIDANSPAGFFRTKQNGQYLISYESYPNLTSLPIENFKKYLEEEDLIITTLPEKKTIQEYYSRCAKSLIVVGNYAEENFEPTEVGMPLEIIAQTNPYNYILEKSFELKVLQNQKPLKSHDIKAICLEDNTTYKQKTNENGCVEFTLKPGKWLVATVAIREYDKDENIDFESFWASLTFEIPKRKN